MKLKSRFYALILVAPAVAVLAFQSERPIRPVAHPLSERAQSSALESVQGIHLGDPLPGITPFEFERFRLGLDDFLEVEDAGEGLGPVFNGRSCAECHSIPRIGGSGNIMETRAGIRHPDGSFENYPEGSLFPLFSIPIHSTQASIPSSANVIAFRRSLPLFGNGLVEAVPEADLISREDPDDLDGDGISGRAARVADRFTGRTLVGRFGWKAQQAKLITFGAEAYRDEMGITNDLFPEELCPFGVDCERLAFIDPVSDPEDEIDPLTGLRGVDNFESFLLFLGPPPRGESTPQALQGEGLFRSVGCSACHVPTLETGSHPSRALSRKRFHPYSDFLLHDIGTGDGIAQVDALPEELRTPPLWGLRLRAPFLHDGRAATLDQAVRMHSNEADASRRAYEGLSPESRANLIAFLRTL